MTFLPIVDRELRVAARRRSTYRLRVWAAGLAIFIVAWVLFISAIFPMRQAMALGKGVFATFSWLLLVFCVFEAVRGTADCLSEEKREGTLGLLFLTDLRGYDVVLGKLAATSLRTLYSLLAVLPVLGLTLLMGGVTGGEFWRMSLALVGVLLFSLTTGLAVSAVSQDARKAMLATLGVLAVWLLLPVGVVELIRFFDSTRSHSVWACVSPLAAFLAAFENTYRLGDRAAFWASLACAPLLSGAALVLACRVLPRRWQDDETPAVQERWRERWQHWANGNPAQRAARRRRWLDENPVLWLAGRQGGQRLALWLLIGLAVVVWIGISGVGRWQALSSTWLTGMAYGFSLVLTWGMKIGVAAQAAYAFAEARRSGAFELLLATPLTSQQIIRGHFGAARRIWLGPALAALALNLVVGLSAVAMPFTLGTVFVLLGSVAASAYGSVRLLCDLLAVFWVASWFGLRDGKANAATIKTILYSQVLPGILICVPGVIPDLIFIAWAHDRLRYGFRDAVQKPLEERAEWVGATAAKRPSSGPPGIASATDVVEPLNR
ncbi:MAG: ABC transporter permease subunit [Verrucomicrobia bacterium]|nr:ABC transporter permease subunit [Verrucomicrobiota bacterium]